jgi:uncharacterized radical SAM superfamily Fe-S cluster-containing enzyme
MTRFIHSHTTALCPVCSRLVPGRIVERGGAIHLEKLCPVDGISSALVCSDPAWYRESRAYVKPGQAPLGRSVGSFSGCPDSCGLCPEHRQHTCLPVVEITSACNLSCPVCLKDLSRPFGMDVAEYRAVLRRLKECEGSIPVLNLSGGEPTLHPDFAEFLRVSRDEGVMQTTVSTNGLRLLEERPLRDLFRESGTIAALQFDGFEPGTWLALRGEDLSGMKRELISLLEREGVRYSLTATVMKGVNDHEILAITDFFFGSGAVSLMFQPAAFTGAGAPLATPERLTIPDVVRGIEGSRHVRPGDFNPLPCSHYSCFALAYYLQLDEGDYLSLKEFLGRENYLQVIANRTLPGLEEEGFALIKERIYDFWSAADSSNDNERVLQRLRTILRELSSTPFSPRRAFELGSSSMKGIFIHQFMDRDTFDLGRLMKCCNQYPQADGRLMPICALNNLFPPP